MPPRSEQRRPISLLKGVLRNGAIFLATATGTAAAVEPMAAWNTTKTIIDTAAASVQAAHTIFTPPRRPGDRIPADPLTPEMRARLDRATPTLPVATATPEKKPIVLPEDLAKKTIKNDIDSKLAVYNGRHPAGAIAFNFDVVRSPIGPLLLETKGEPVKVRSLPYKRDVDTRIPTVDPRKSGGYLFESIPGRTRLRNAASYFVIVSNPQTGSADIWNEQQQPDGQFRYVNARDSEQFGDENEKWNLDVLDYDSGEKIDPGEIFGTYIPLTVPTTIL